MTASELERMRNPLSVKNVDRIRRLLRTIDFTLSSGCRDIASTRRFAWEISDELSECRAILEEWKERRKRK